jgi:hypothetical protein
MPLGATEPIADVRVTQAIDDRFPRPTVGIAASAGPTLAFHLSLTYRCPADTREKSLFASIADTVHVEDIPPGQPSPVTVRIEVPIRQIPWLEQPGAACATIGRRPDQVGSDGTGYFRLHAAATGFVTLTCRSGDGHESAADSSAALDVWLSCPPAPANSAAR